MVQIILIFYAILKFKNSIEMKYFYIVFLFFISNIFAGFAQELDWETFSKKPKFKVSGGINADFMYFNDASQDNPLTYMLTGNLNFSLWGFSFPVSYTLTNQGNALNYQVPFNFNRFSIAPKYK